MRVVVAYSDSPKAGTVSPAETNYHNEVLRIIENWYQTSLAALNRRMSDIVAWVDAKGLVQLRQEIADLKAEDKREVDSENARYADTVALAASQATPNDIKVWGNRDAPSASVYLIGWTGSGTQETTFSALGGAGYYFRVQAAGSWTINVYR